MADAVPQLNFATYRQLHAALSAKRMALLEFVALHPGLNPRQIASRLSRQH